MPRLRWLAGKDFIFVIKDVKSEQANDMTSDLQVPKLDLSCFGSYYSHCY